MTVRGGPMSAVPGDDTFDRALATAARSLVVQPLPPDLLVAPRPIPARSWRRTGAPLATAVAAVVLAIGSVVVAPRLVETDAGQAFRTGGDLSTALRTSGYDCRAGTSVASGVARMEALVCTATTPSVLATVIVSEDSAGDVMELHMASDIVGPPTPKTERDQATFLDATVGQAFVDPATAAAVRAWLADALPLDPGARVRTSIEGVPVVLERGAGGYSIVLGDLGAGPQAVPSP